MTAHELARLLLELPDVEVIVTAQDEYFQRPAEYKIVDVQINLLRVELMKGAPERLVV
jgi:hypothetical protein